MKEAKEKEAAKKLRQMEDWSEEELRMLDKALRKYPQVTVALVH